MGVCGSTKFKRKYPELYSIKFDETSEIFSRIKGKFYKYFFYKISYL